ncbi:MAG: TRAP transporter permease DctQ [Gammaproteobacteria bacterium]|nr:MAG: TRAP transporter permease DctQ [Gammaproteobacteria bacterium]
MILKFLDNMEKYFCQLLLAVFVCILFAQIVLREVFGYSIPWSEELSVYLFVWFAYFGASFAVRKSAHNRVTFQYKLLPKNKVWIFELLSDIIWLIFNLIIMYFCYEFVFNKMNSFWKSQTVGVPMKYVYLILPLAFALMSIRVIQVNYIKFIQHKTISDPEAEAVEELLHKDHFEAEKK